jgi:hypothetical protein
MGSVVCEIACVKLPVRQRPECDDKDTEVSACRFRELATFDDKRLSLFETVAGIGCHVVESR